MSPNGKGRPEAAHGTPAKKFTPNLPEATDLQVILLEAAEAAWETGRPVLVAGHVVVPDVALVEGIANGLQPPDTSYALEKDGRACYPRTRRTPFGWLTVRRRRCSCSRPPLPGRA